MLNILPLLVVRSFENQHHLLSLLLHIVLYVFPLILFSEPSVRK